MCFERSLRKSKMEADAEVRFYFIGSRKGKVCEGYRPAHLIKEDYLTTGLHHYYSLNEDSDGGIAGTITFITPEAYPSCLWEGKEIKMYDGRKLVGYAVIKKIFNSILAAKEDK